MIEIKIDNVFHSRASYTDKSMITLHYESPPEKTKLI